MPRGASWGSAEVAALSTAYVNASNNPLVGADQRAEAFIADILVKFQRLAPRGLDAASGKYHHRVASVWPYRRDNVFRDVQKFNVSLRLVYSCAPTGVIVFLPPSECPLY